MSQNDRISQQYCNSSIQTSEKRITSLQWTRSQVLMCFFIWRFHCNSLYLANDILNNISPFSQLRVPATSEYELALFFPPYPSGMQITGNDSPFVVGTGLQLNCSSDLPILMAEWLYNEVVITQSAAAEALLVIPVVNDSLHNMQYKCRITTPFGVQERNTTITVIGTYTQVLYPTLLAKGIYYSQCYKEWPNLCFRP